MKIKTVILLAVISIFACGLLVSLCSCSGNDEKGTDDDSAGDDDSSPADDDSAVNPFLAPEKRGPYLVGNTSYFFEDDSRELGCDPGGNRVLLTEVWYPADDSAAALPENMIDDFFLGRTDEVKAALEAAGYTDEDPINLPTGSYRDAPLRPNTPLMPLLFFSHGFSSNRFQNYTMAAYLASHGYIVIAPDHACNSIATLTPDDVVILNVLYTVKALPDRKADLIFLIDIFTENPPEMFAGRLDAAHIGLFGHSFGGITVSETIKIEPRASAMIQLAAFGFPPVPAEVKAPSMYFSGREDKVMHPYEFLHNAYIEQMPPPKLQLEFFDTGHFTFSDLCRFVPRLMASGNGCGTETRIGSDELFTNPSVDSLHEVMDPYSTAFFGSVFFQYEELISFLAINHNATMMDYIIVPVPN